MKAIILIHLYDLENIPIEMERVLHDFWDGIVELEFENIEELINVANKLKKFGVINTIILKR